MPRFIGTFDLEDPAHLAAVLGGRGGHVVVALVEAGGDAGVLVLGLDAEREDAHLVDLLALAQGLDPAERQQPPVQLLQHLVVVGEGQRDADRLAVGVSATIAQFSSRIGFSSLA